MIFLFMELDDYLMTYFMFQEQYGIQLCVENQKKGCRRAIKGTRNVDFCRHWMSGRQEGHLHMEFTISSILRWVSNVIIGWYEC